MSHPATRKRCTRWRDPFRLGRSSLIAQLQAYQRSRAMPTEVRETIGLVLARVEVVRIDDLAMLLHFTREHSYRRASVEDVIEAARVAFFFAGEVAA